MGSLLFTVVECSVCGCVQLLKANDLEGECSGIDVKYKTWW